MKVVAKYLSNIALEKRILIEELELSEFYSFYSNELDELRSMCNALIGGKRTGGRLKSLKIDNKVSLNEHSVGFKDCITLETISLELYDDLNKGTFLLARHFSGCKSLKSIILRESNTHSRHYTVDGVLYGSHILIKYPANKGTEFTIPANVDQIGNLAFEDSQLTTLTFTNPIPATCEEDAFKGVNPATLVIRVPKGCHDSFWAHPVFGKFNIEEIAE